MKKVLVFVLILCTLLAAVVLSGCSGDPNDNGDPDVNNGADADFDPSAYQAPADFAEIDMAKEDPSNDRIRFGYDAEGRISRCDYEIDGQQVYVNYVYEDGQVQIYAFMGEFLVADEHIDLSEFDASVGFAEYNGYFFKGYEF